MTETKFRSEMRRAEAMRTSADDPMMSEYWVGYVRGLRLAYHGDKFGEPGEHEKWLTLVDSRDERKKQRGRGYRDGIAFDEISSRKGRPSVGGAMMDQLTVPTDLKEAIEAKAEALCISVPDARREAYREWVSKNSQDETMNKKMICSNADCEYELIYEKKPKLKSCPKCGSLLEYNDKWFDGKKWVDKKTF